VQQFATVLSRVLPHLQLPGSHVERRTGIKLAGRLTTPLA
jgi:hypothetical protein